MVWFDPDLPVLRIHLYNTGPTARLTACCYRALAGTLDSIARTKAVQMMKLLWGPVLLVNRNAWISIPSLTIYTLESWVFSYSAASKGFWSFRSHQYSILRPIPALRDTKHIYPMMVMFWHLKTYLLDCIENLWPNLAASCKFNAISGSLALIQPARQGTCETSQSICLGSPTRRGKMNHFYFQSNVVSIS